MDLLRGRGAALLAKRALWLSVCLLVVWGAAVFWSGQQRRFGKFPYDDTYITLRYAENLALHGRLSFNLDDRIDGYSSPAWTLLLAAAIRLGADGERAAVALSWLSGLLGILGSGVLARRLGASWPATLAIACLGTATSVGWIVWSAPGMETPFVGVCALALLTAHTVGEPGSRLRGAMALLVAAARPEGVILVAVSLASDAFLLLRRPVDERRPGLRRLLVVMIVLAAAFTAHWAYYGAPLPNTYYAKLSGMRHWDRGLNDLRTFLNTHAVGAGLCAAVLLLDPAWPAPRHPPLALLAWAAASGFAYAAAGGDYLEHHRFYQPLVPTCFAMLAALVRAPRGTSARALAGHALTVLVAAAVGTWLYVDGRRALGSAWTGYLPNAATYALRWRQAGVALARSYPPGTSMSIRAAGAIPYITRFRSFDTLGLNTREVALHPGIVRPDDPGHAKEASPAQVVAWQPDLIVNHPIFRERDESGLFPQSTPPEYRAAGYTFRCLLIGDGTWICVYEHPRLGRHTVEDRSPRVLE